LDDPLPPRDLNGPGQAAHSAEPAAGPRLTRRELLRAVVAGGVAVGVASLGYWGLAPAVRPAPATPTLPTPPGSYPAGSFLYRTRPDLWSPTVDVVHQAAGAADGCILLTPATGPGPVIVDDAGHTLWVHPNTESRAFNLRMATYQGRPVLTWFEGQIVLGTGRGEYVLMDETYAEVTRVRAGNGLAGDLHEFIVTPEGTALFTAYVQAPEPGATLVASPTAAGILDSVVQEVDIATGRVLFEWHASEHIDIAESYASRSADAPFDFFHVNSIDVEPDGNLLVSARHTWTVYRINRSTGQVIWRLGGKKSDFAMEPATSFSWQHDARRQPDGSISLFDDGSNGTPPPTEDHSRAIVLDVDEVNFTATLRRAYGHDPLLSAGSQGSVQALPNGDFLVGWGDQPWFTEYTADGDTVLDASMPNGSFSYRAFRFEWHGRPLDRPTVVAMPFDGVTTLYASWNGATEIADWVVLGGPAADALSPISTQPWIGFETALTISSQPAFVAARALDGSGAVLGESGAIATT